MHNKDVFFAIPYLEARVSRLAKENAHLHQHTRAARARKSAYIISAHMASVALISACDRLQKVRPDRLVAVEAYELVEEYSLQNIADYYFRPGRKNGIVMTIIISSR